MLVDIGEKLFIIVKLMQTERQKDKGS